MQQEPQHYTPTQILEAGQQAEADGRISYALRFYDHLAGNYGWAPEAVAARAALVRLREPAAHEPPNIPALNGAGASTPLPGASASYANGYRHTHRGITVAPMDVAVRVPLTVPRPNASYRIGSFLAGLVLLAGAATLISGAALLLAPTWGFRLAQFTPAQPYDSPVAGVGMIAGGLMLVLAGELLRAVFAQARATRELAAIARARAEFEAAEVDRLRVSG